MKFCLDPSEAWLVEDMHWIEGLYSFSIFIYPLLLIIDNIMNV